MRCCVVEDVVEGSPRDEGFVLYGLVWQVGQGSVGCFVWGDVLGRPKVEGVL